MRRTPTLILTLMLLLTLFAGTSFNQASPIAEGRMSGAPGDRLPSPQSIFGSRLKYWMRADAEMYTDAARTTRAMNGQPVYVAGDRSGNGYDIIQATASKRPTFVANSGFSNQPALRFDIDKAQEMTQGSFPYISGASKATRILVYHMLTANNAGLVGTVNGGFDYYHLPGGAGTVYSMTALWEYGVSHQNVAGRGPFLGVQGFDGTALGDTNRMKLRINRKDRTLTFPGIISSIIPAYPIGFRVGRQNGSSEYFNGYLLEQIFVNDTITPDELAQIETYVQARYFSNEINSVMCEGDSLTEGYPITFNELSYPAKLTAQLGRKWIYRNAATRAEQTSNMLLQGDSQIDQNRNEWRARDITVLLAGTNDLFQGVSTATLKANLKAWCELRRSRGFKVIIGTIMVAGGNDVPGDYEAKRVEINQWLRDNYQTFADRLVDFAADPRLDDYNDATYFYSGDFVHMTAAGNEAMAELVKAQIDAL